MKLFLAVVLFLLMEGGLYLYLDGPKRGDLRCKALTTLMAFTARCTAAANRGCCSRRCASASCQTC